MTYDKRLRSIPNLPIIDQGEDKENFFYQIIDTLPFPLLVVEPNFKISMANQAAKKMYFNNRTDLTYCYQLLHNANIPCNKQECLCPLEKFKETLKPVLKEQLYKLANGNQVPVEICALPVVNSQGQLTKAVEIIMDISERKQAREMHNRYEQLSHNTRDIIMFIDMGGRILEANRAAEVSYGFNRAELLQMNIKDLRDLETSDQVDAQMKLAFRKGLLFETLHRRRDGSVFPVEVNSQKIPIGHDHVLLSIVRDITERKQAEEKIVAAHRQMMDIIEFLPDATLAVNREKKVIAWNRAMEEMTGISKIDIIGQGNYAYSVPFYGDRKPVLLDLLWAEREQIEKHYHSVARNGDILYAEAFAPLMNGGQGIHLWLKASPLYDGAGNMVGAIESIRDVTGFKQTQEALTWEAQANAALAELSNALANSDSIEEQTGLVLELGKRLTGSQFGFVGYIDQQKGYLVSPTMSRDVWDICQVPDKNIIFKKFNGLYGWVINNKQSLLTNNPESDPRSTGVPQGHIPIERFLAAPALLGERLMGVVCLANSTRDYTNRDLELVERLSSLYALAIRRKIEEERMSKINDCFLSFSSNPNENINRLTTLCGELMGASSAVYNRMNQGMLHSAGQWNTPPDYKPVDIPEGHICYDVIRRGGDEVTVLRNLQSTPYAETDPNVAAFGLRTYIGHPVKVGQACVGALCVVYQQDYAPSLGDQKILGIIASAIRVEEERKQALVRLRESKEFNQAVLNSLTAHIAVLDGNGNIAAVNEAWKHFGRNNNADTATITARNINYLEICKKGAQDGDQAARDALTGITDVLEGRKPQYSMEYPCHTDLEKRWYLLHATPLSGRAGGAVISHQEITDRKKNEARQEAELAMLAELANFTNLKQALHNLLGILTRVTGCQAAAIRMTDGNDFTYYTQRGFSNQFIAHESSLCQVNEDGPVCDEEGQILLECFCGMTLKNRLLGRVDSNYTTPYGSFLTGFASGLKDDEKGPLQLEGPWRLTCVRHGYETIVLVPIKDDGRNIGLLQLNGKHKNLVTRDDMPFLELASRYIASAIQHMKDSEALQESEGRYRRLAENAPDVIYRINLVPERRFEYVSPAVEQMIGYTPEEHYQDSELVYNIVHPDDRSLQQQLECADEDCRAPKELRWVGKNGQIIWTEQRNLLIRDRDGQVVAMEGIARDITERKKVEFARQRQALNERTMTEAMSIFTGNHNQDDVLAELLELLAERQGYRKGAYLSYDEWSRSLKAIASRAVDEKLLPQSIALQDNQVADIIMGKKIQIIPAEENTMLPFIHSATAVIPVYYQDWLQGVLLLGTTRETSPFDRAFLKRVSLQLGICLYGIKQFEYLKALSQQLAIRQKEIEKKNRELEQANRAKSEFLTNMSHELRTPLNSVIGFSELLERQDFGELNLRQQEYVKDIRESGEHLLDLINDILDLSKIEAGSMELDLSEFELQDLLQGSLRMFREKALKKNIRLNMVIDENISLVVADSRKLKQVVFNLLANAVKFTESGGEVLLSATLNGSNVTVCVADNGIGINESDMDKLFKEFSQVDGSLSRRHEGTGLGLALSAKLVEMHGGAIGVESESGQGSKFFFSIPLFPPPSS